MFQSFSASSRPEQGPPRLAALRSELQSRELDGFLVPRADVHQGEYVAARDERLSWLTGFTGSAGFCIALRDKAGVFIDGRYTLQVSEQVDTEAFTPVSWPATTAGAWVKYHLSQGTIGFDPWLHTKRQIERIRKDAGDDITLQRTSNLVDQIWQDQPPPPAGKVSVQPDRLAGQTHAVKRQELAKGLLKKNCSAAVLTLPDSISWLFNIRGSDIPRNPVVHAFAILRDDGSAQVFIDSTKLLPEVRAHLGDNVELHEPERFQQILKELTGTILVDPETAPVAVFDLLEAEGILVAEAQDPCILPKSRKTAAELEGTREAHLRDGTAMVEFLSWLDASVGNGISEIDVVRELETRRRATNALRDISFETICGSGPNGAIVHYRVTEETNRQITPGDLLLVDSGGQYQDGTTDITRTIWTGEPPEGAREAFTRVLQGMIAISRTRFPNGLAGRDLDALARAPLWMAGQDYDHGTGHGVGAFLSVHEGPQRLSRLGTTALDPGMILSNEPGYYREGAFGIRIENLIVVKRAPDIPGQDKRDMLSFETLTFAPIDLRLIIAELMSQDEIRWLNDYHAEVAERLGSRVCSSARDWLSDATRPIG